MKKLSTEKRIVKDYLVQQPLFRERRNKNRGIGNLILKLHPSTKDIPKDVMTEIIDEVLAMDRAWRWWLEDKNRPDLRGKDYFKHRKTKRQLEQEAKQELGYEVGYYQNIKNYYGGLKTN